MTSQKICTRMYPKRVTDATRLFPERKCDTMSADPNTPVEDLEPDHPYVRECAAETSGDDISKSDYMDMYLAMGMEGDY